MLLKLFTFCLKHCYFYVMQSLWELMMNTFNRGYKNTFLNGYTPVEIISFLTDNIFHYLLVPFLQAQACKSHFVFGILLGQSSRFTERLVAKSFKTH